ncbi:hypothetical protein LINPERPRIM_LOCUS20333 [Linum perenne]
MERYKKRNYFFYFVAPVFCCWFFSSIGCSFRYSVFLHWSFLFQVDSSGTSWKHDMGNSEGINTNEAKTIVFGLMCNLFLFR